MDVDNSILEFTALVALHEKLMWKMISLDSAVCGGEGCFTTLLVLIEFLVILLLMFCHSLGKSVCTSSKRLGQLSNFATSCNYCSKLHGIT